MPLCRFCSYLFPTFVVIVASCSKPRVFFFFIIVFFSFGFLFLVLSSGNHVILLEYNILNIHVMVLLFALFPLRPFFHREIFALVYVAGVFRIYSILVSQ